MKRGFVIIRNAIRCKNCGEILESKSRHDFVSCRCFKESGGSKGCFADGGKDYLRFGGDPDEYENLSETRPYTDEEVDEYNERQKSLAERYVGLYNCIQIDYMEK